jgi:PPOX class probable F420-dependent enzyme
MELHDALEFARPRHQGVLVTRRGDGRPQLSNILYHLSDTAGAAGRDGRGAGAGDVGGAPADAAGAGGDLVVRISVTESRAKTRNLRRDPVASLYVPGESFWAYVVLDGTAELSPVASAPDDETVEELVKLYRAISGRDHPDWAEYRESMVAERRLVARLHPTHAYGLLAR